ncbi:MAG: HNH endonuclease, partial [Chloroflexi bacterium]|nr:HNH endonuclease [Chloroflexota bacterium]
QLLKASHITPWRHSNDVERLDRFNGLLLAANYDAAFDVGLVTFGDAGQMLISRRLTSEDCKRLGIARNAKISGLAPEHHVYLKHHREEIFQVIVKDA